MKKIFCILTVCLILSLSVVAAFAAPAENPAGDIIGPLSIGQVETLATAVTYQLDFINSSSFSTGGGMIPLFITAVLPSSAQQVGIYSYKVYIAPVGSSLAINSNWKGVGASVTINNATYMYKCNYNFSATGGMGYRSYTYFGSNQFTLAANEQIIYVLTGSNQATNPKFNTEFTYSETNVSSNAFVAPVRWINAMSAYNGNLSPEAITNSYNLGVSDGQAEGYSSGYKAGFDYADRYYTPLLEGKYADGYSFGYNAGYSDAVDELSNGEHPAYYLDIPAIFSAIPAAAKSVINTAFGFEIFGINVAGLLSALLVVSIIIFVVRWLVKK